jgi:hypothetical protein
MMTFSFVLVTSRSRSSVAEENHTVPVDHDEAADKSVENTNSLLLSLDLVLSWLFDAFSVIETKF